jgi:cytochrome c2
MREAVHVVTPAAFATWAKAQASNGAPPIGIPPSSAGQYAGPINSSAARVPAGASPTSAAAGKAVFTGAAGCTGCHTLGAANATGTIGPNLDQRLRSDCATAASKRIRGATLQKCISTAITDPYKYLPAGYKAGIMPSNFAQTLTSTQIQALVTFLSSAAK